MCVPVPCSLYKPIMFHQRVHVIIIMVISVTHVNSFVRKLDRQRREEIRPRYHDEYVTCQNHICDRVNDYPEMKILEAMRKKESLKSILGNVLVYTYNVTTLDSRNNFDLGEEKRLCSTVGPTTHVPKVMRNVNLEWKFVVNVEGFEQIFTSETCRYDSGKILRSEYLWGVDFKCQQIEQEIYLLVFEDGIIDFDKFRIPITCNSFCV